MTGGIAPVDVGRALIRTVLRPFRVSSQLVSMVPDEFDGRVPWGVRRRGYLRPGDPSPPLGVDVLDYRGIAPPGQLRPLEDAGLPIGRAIRFRRRPGRQLALPMPALFRHAVVLGPSGSGKTTSIIVPWIVALLRQGCSIVTVDVKGDLLAEVRDYTAATGGPIGSRLWYWDSSVTSSHRWNWLRELDGPQAVEAAVTSIIGRLRDTDPQPHFHHRDHRWLRALIQLLRAVYQRRAEPGYLLDLLNDQQRLATLLRQTPAGTPGAADLTDLAALGPDEYARGVAGLTNALSVFALPNVSRVSAESDFDVSRICDAPTLLVAGAPLAQGRVSEILSSILTGQTLVRILERFQTRSQLQRPLFFVLDEAARLKDRVDFDQLLATSRGAGVGVCLAAQDVTQFGDERERAAILANCHAMVLMPGCSQPTARFLADRLGDRLVEQRSASHATARKDGATVTYSRQTATGPVLGLREIMYPPFGPYTATVHVPSVSRAPFLVDLER